MSLYEQTTQKMRWANGHMPVRRKIANNTYLERLVDNSIAVRLHATDVVVIFPDDVVVLNSGGWRTKTTKDRLNRFAGPFTVVSERRERGPGGTVWTIRYSPDWHTTGRTAPWGEGSQYVADFYDGISLDARVRPRRTEPLFEDLGPDSRRPLMPSRDHNHPVRADLCFDPDCPVCRAAFDATEVCHWTEMREGSGVDCWGQVEHLDSADDGAPYCDVHADARLAMLERDEDWDGPITRCEFCGLSIEPGEPCSCQEHGMCANDCGRPAVEQGNGPGEDGQWYCLECQ